MQRLQDPFLPEDIEWRVGATNADKSKGIALAYVTNRAIMSRLDAIFGPFGWRNEFREWKGTSQLCGISILWNGEWITKWDGADDSQTEAVKGGLSDAMKRAGYQWGIGRYLYNLENQWAPIKQQGRSYVLAQVPKLPLWALPSDFKYTERTQKVFEPPSDTSAEAPPSPNDLHLLFDEPAEQPAKPPAQKEETVSAVRTRVYKLRGELGWGWDDLVTFATESLKREVKLLNKDITDVNDWKLIESLLLQTKRAS
ncbi:hypothetical protein EDM21_12755 [Paenibacillus sp. N10]|uniref:Rad52/22 double-strand break repair protein n=2 Tax=Paenibacillus lutrae TaxID=2078573 RepID=A0A7X3JZR9_9BACL|nr:hypothetical protein [Paenibacillus lutrae]